MRLFGSERMISIYNALGIPEGEEIQHKTISKTIEKAQKNLVKAKHRYDAAAATLKDLLDKRDALRQKKLLDAIAQSGRSYEEIMQYLHSKSEEA